MSSSVHRALFSFHGLHHAQNATRQPSTMSDDTVEKTVLVLAIESGDVDAVREAVEAAGDAEARVKAVNAEEPKTWHSSLHKAASIGTVEVTRLLLDLGADPNAEDIKGRTCLHLACDAYARDTRGESRFDECIIALVDAGAFSVEDVSGALPNPGDDAGGFVRRALDTAFENGAEERKRKRKAKFDAVFSGKLRRHMNNASAVAITVADSGETDGYWCGSR